MKKLFNLLPIVMNWWIVLIIWIVVYWLLDAFGASTITKIFHNRLKKLLKKDVDWIAALIVWILMTWGLLIFVISSPAVTDAWDAFSMWMIFGMIVYGVYECTNQALLKKRHRTLVLVDTAWWMLLCGSVSVFLWYLIQYFWLVL